MPKNYLIGIDVGSSFVKASIFDTRGNALGEVKGDNHPSQPRPGVAEYDGPKMYRSILDAIRRLLVKTEVAPGAIAALSVDGMQSGVMGIDAHGVAITPYTTTLDIRFAPQLNYVMDHFHDLIREKTGAGQPCFAPKIRWIRQEYPDVYRRIHKFVTIGDFLIGKLAGLSGDEAFIGCTYLWMTGLSDTPRYTWSEELCHALEIPMAKLPRIVQSSDTIGAVSSETASATGLKAGTPIIAGCGDQLAGFIGTGITRPGRAGDVAGTYPVIAFCTGDFRPDLQGKRTEILPSPIPGLYNPISFINGGGLTHHWFLESFGAADAVEAARRGEGSTAYSVLDDAASQIAPGSDKLIFIPHLGGRACPTNTELRGMWAGFTWTHTRAHFYRAMLEATAYDHVEALQSLQATYPESSVDEIIVYGGGAKSTLWNQIKADVMGLPYISLGRDDLSALGVAILAGYGVGLFDDLAKTAARFVKTTQRFEPRNDVHAFYCDYAEYYRSLLNQSEPAFHELAQLPEWPIQPCAY